MVMLSVLDCRDCGKRLAPPAYACSQCGSANVAPRDIPAEGNLYTYTTIYMPPSGFEHLVPYTVAVVQVAGGLLISGRMQVGSEIPSIGTTLSISRAEGTYIFKARR